MTRRRTSRQLAPRLLLALALSLGRAPLAHAQAAPVNPAQFQVYPNHFAWDGDLLRANFSFKDVLDPAVRQKLSNGPESVIAMRAFVFREGETAPVRLVVQECRVAYDLWNEVYNVQVSDAAGATKAYRVVNMNGVERLCTVMQNLPVAPRSALKAGVPHFLAVVVDVNPVSPAVRAQIQQWMQQQAQGADVGMGASLFSGVAALFFRNVGASDRTVEFRTAPVVP